MYKQLKRQLFMWGQIIAGALICSLSYNLFLIPNDIVPGGFTGIAQLISHAAGWRVGTVTLLINIPLFLFSARTLGVFFVIRSLTATVLLSLLLDLLPVFSLIPRDTADRMMLSALFGGALGGIGFGLILRGGATTGGSDMLAKLLKQYVPSIRLGSVMFAVDATVITASALMFDIVSAMFALIAAYLMSHIIDALLDGVHRAHSYFIISQQHDKIAERIMTELKRGATSLKGRGLYSGKDKDVLLCVVSRMEAALLRTIVAEVDPQAFMIAANVHEVLGEGFTPHRVSSKVF